jgi:Zn-dependent peptidase ImmA (M78 family)
MTRLNKTNLTSALRESKGAVSIAAKRLGVSRRAIYARLEQWPDVKEIMEDVRNEVCDVAELKLYAMINNDEHKDQLKAIQYQLDTHGRARGWGTPPTTQIEVRAKVDTATKVDVSKLDDATLLALANAKKDV